MTDPSTATSTAASIRHALELARADIDTALGALSSTPQVPLGVTAEVLGATTTLVEALERLANAVAP